MKKEKNKYINLNGKITFGKYKYKNIKYIPLDYLIWVQKNMYDKMNDKEKSKLDICINTQLDVEWIKNLTTNPKYNIFICEEQLWYYLVTC